jgi:hypothetical protein
MAATCAVGLRLRLDERAATLVPWAEHIIRVPGLHGHLKLVSDVDEEE